MSSVVARDPELARELAQRAGSANRKLVVDLRDDAEAALELPGGLAGIDGGSDGLFGFLRPVLRQLAGGFELPDALAWRARLDAVRTRLDAAGQSVGRLITQGTLDHTEVAVWMITTELAVTSRRAALGFAGWSARGARLRPNLDGSAAAPRVVFGTDLFEADAIEATVVEVAYLAELSELHADVALLRLQALGPRPLPPPVTLTDEPLLTGQYVAVLASRPTSPPPPGDRRDGGGANNQATRTLRPGQITSLTGGVDVAQHDCVTARNQSGGVVIDLASGCAVGLHVGSDGDGAGSMVGVTALREAVHRAGRHFRVVLRDRPTLAATATGATIVAVDLVDRAGYQADFLGRGALAVPLPGFSRALGSRTAIPAGAEHRRGSERFMLRYEHFSLAMHQERRLAIFTATNIDGAQARRVKRGSDNWAFDPRLPETVQLGPELYADNDLDRGHLTRRLDPAWGDQTVASRAEQDTFFYTNASPQQSRFNQQIWAGLEDYLLDHADNLDFRATVFTGPIFSAADRPYRGALLPLAYWKIAVMVNALTGQLSATAYLVSQADLLPTATFTFGEYKTYQLPLARVEEMTGLAFPKLRPFDPLGTAALPQVLAGHRDIVLQPRVAAGQAVPVLGLPRR